MLARAEAMIPSGFSEPLPRRAAVRPFDSKLDYDAAQNAVGLEISASSMPARSGLETVSSTQRLL